MRPWLHKHRIVTGLIWTVQALGAIEGVLVFYYLSSWVILPTL
jgi:hypothetical protein